MDTTLDADDFRYLIVATAMPDGSTLFWVDTNRARADIEDGRRDLHSLSFPRFRVHRDGRVEQDHSV